MRTLPASAPFAQLPALYRDSAFWGMTITQFLGAFNDNLFKQLVLLLSVMGPVAAVAAEASSRREEDLQWVAMFVFALPFVLFSGYAGFLSDRNGKRAIIVLIEGRRNRGHAARYGGVLRIRALGLDRSSGRVVLHGSAKRSFSGRASIGILPEMLRGADLPRANGIILMTTFLAIILGTAVAGVLKHWLGSERLWLASTFCVGLAVVGTFTSLLVRRTPAAHPGLKFHGSSLAVPPDITRLLRADGPLLAALLASCMFWLVGGLVHPSVNYLGIQQLKQNEAWTSLMVASMAVGIAAGCLIAGLLSRGRIDGRMVRIGSWGTVAMLLLLAAPGFGTAHLLGFAGSVPALVALGFFAGMFAVPVQVYLQSRPPRTRKGG